MDRPAQLVGTITPDHITHSGATLGDWLCCLVLVLLTRNTWTTPVWQEERPNLSLLSPLGSRVAVTPRR